MHLLAFQNMSQGVKKVFLRFPLAMLAALIGTASAYSIIHFESLIDEWVLYRLLMTAVLGFLLFIALQLRLERAQLKKNSEYLLIGLAAIFLGLYYWLLPNDFDLASAAFGFRFILFTSALLFSLTFAPFIKHLKEVNGFWQYNKALFIRLFFTFVFTGTLYIGLVLALVGAKQLLDINFDSKLYFELWIIIVGLVSTSFFLFGLPKKTSELQENMDYHKGIKLFAQYILIPLVLIYALILYIYTGKIIFRWDWPEGTVSWLIIVFSLVTILANFLLHPLLKKEKWVQLFSTFSYTLILPMTGVMFLAFKIRINEYGVTEARYYGIILCFWFLLTGLYFILSKKKNLIYLPISLFIITIISSAGPVSSMNVSKWSQMNRLESTLIKNDLLVKGKFKKNDVKPSREDLIIISGALDYIYRMHDTAPIQKWFKKKLVIQKEGKGCYAAQCITELMGLEYVDPWQRQEPFQVNNVDQYRNYYVGEEQVLNIEGFRFISNFSLYNNSSDSSEPVTYTLNEPYHKLILNPESQKITVLTASGKEFDLDLKPLTERLKTSNSYLASWEDMSVESQGVRLALRNVNFTTDNSGQIKWLQSLDGYLLTK